MPRVTRKSRRRPSNGAGGPVHRAAGVEGPENAGGRAPESLAYRAGFAQLIAAISRDFLGMAPDQIDRGIRDALRAVGEYAGVDRAFLFRLSHDASLLVNTHEWCAEPADSQLEKFQDLPTKALPGAGSRIASRKALCVPRVSELPPEARAEKDMWESVGSKSLIILPLQAAGGLLGAVGLDTMRDEREWSDDLIASLGTVAEALANVLDRKQRDEALRESEERFRTIVENAYDRIIVIAPDGRLLLVGPDHHNVAGWEPGELRGTDFSELLHPDDRESVLSQLEQLLSSGTVQAAFRVRHKDGTYRWLESTGRTFETPRGGVQIISISRDITDRKLAEEALRQREEQLRTLFSTSRDANSLVVDGVCVDCNEAFLELLQATRDQVIGKSPASFSPERQPDGRLSVDAAEEKAREVMETGSARFEWVLRRMDGTEFWIEMVSTAAKIDGRDGFSSVGRDISQRKRAEEELRESEKKYKSLFESSGDASFIMSVSEKEEVCFVDCNNSTLPLFGCTERHQILGKPPRDFSPATQPDGRPSVEKARQLTTATMAGDPQVFEWECHRLDGTPFFVEVTLSRIDFRGKALMQAVVRDITDRKRAEEAQRESTRRLVKAQRVAGMGFLDWNLKTNEMYWSPQVYEIYGIDERRVKASIDLTLELVHPDDLEFVQKNLDMAIAGVEEYDIDHRNLRPDGEVIWVHAQGELVRDAYGNPESLLGTIIDITEQKQAEEERINLEKQLQHAQKLESLGVLAGGIAHDFNNVLMAILGNADLALGELSPLAPARKSVEAIERASRGAAALAKQMLAYSGKAVFEIEPIDLNECVREIADLLEVSISKKAALRCNFADNLPAIEGDVAQIQQVVMNLITNASEAVGEEDGVIALSTGATDCDRAYLDDVNGISHSGLREPLPEGVYVHLEVADTGCGMNAENVEKIFDPFFTTKFTGRGLGMSAVLGIVGGHKGMIRIDSQAGRGSSFRVLFPAIDRPAELLRNEPPETREWHGSGTVLLVDDDKAVLDAEKGLLEMIGFRVLTASDGREALDLFRARGAELACVLLDLTMPQLDGEQVFREIRRLRPDARVILSSGYDESDVRGRFAGEGLAGFIQKPYRSGALRAKLREVLES